MVALPVATCTPFIPQLSSTLTQGPTPKRWWHSSHNSAVFGGGIWAGVVVMLEGEGWV